MNGIMAYCGMLLESNHMVDNKSQDDLLEVIAALLHDVSDIHGEVFNTRSLRNTMKIVKRRLLAEGTGFLTKSLPRLGKALDRALIEGRLTRNMYTVVEDDSILGITGAHPWLCHAKKTSTFAVKHDTELPIFMGEFFSRVFGPDGAILQQPCVSSVRVLRQVLYLFYKYELPYTDEQRRTVVDTFKRTEDDLHKLGPALQEIEARVTSSIAIGSRRAQSVCDEPYRPTQEQVVREARILLSNLFAFFDPTNIQPRHGPGAVATRQKLWGKYVWKNVSKRITDLYPFDAYFCASAGHVCDCYKQFSAVSEEDLPARVCLVPKDSRGPRLISCEPVDFQWVQQGLGKAIVGLVERHPLTKGIVNFTDQGPNQNVALLASRDGRYATLDLKEASDRMHLGLVRMLFPEHLYRYLEATRSTSTELPDGEVLKLQKFAPMGSSLCFPILAVTLWAILTAGAPNTHVRKRMLVYGDDVIVPAEYAGDAIKHLESFGFLVNHDKSCITGLFRESCGRDAFQGVDVTPVRLRTVWSSSRCPNVYTSWIAYANAFWDRAMYRTYFTIVGRLQKVYDNLIPSDDMHIACPSLRYLPECQKPKRKRRHRNYQKLQYWVYDVRSPVINKAIPGWLMLLRYFAEAPTTDPINSVIEQALAMEAPFWDPPESFRVRSYTRRSSSMLVERWR